MEFKGLELIIGSIGTVLIGLLAAGAKALIDYKKSNTTNNLSANEQAFIVYKELVENLQKDLIRINKNLKELEKEYLSCRECNVELRIKLENAIENNEKLAKLLSERDIEE